MTSQTSNRESGMSIVIVVIVISLVAVVVGVLMQAADGGRREASRTMSRAEQIAIADTAVSRYLAALNSTQATRKTNFQLTTNAFGANSPLARFVASDELRIYPYGPTSTRINPRPGQCTGSVDIVPTSPRVVRREGANGGAAWPVDDSTVGPTRFIVEENHAGRPCSYWEVFRVDPMPLANLTNDLSSHRHIGVVFRVWSSSSITRVNGAVVLNPRYVQTTLSRGSFSDYQLLTDEHIRFGTGVNITGKVHSNNYDDQTPAIDDPSGGVSCSGPDAKVTAQARGIGFAGSCQVNGATNRAIDLGAMSLAVEDLKAACASDATNFRTRCFPALGGAGYEVEVGNPVRVYNRTSGALLATVNHGSRPYAMLFEEDNVYVRDGAAFPVGSVSIFAHSDDVSHIHILGERFGPPAANKPVVGLLAQGDIVIESVQPSSPMQNPSPRCNDVRINAALMSETGTLTVPHKWLSPIRQSRTPKCGTLTLEGAVATRTMPLLQMVWAGRYGFEFRNLNWNRTLKRVVPPMYPATGPWEMGSWREPNHDCLNTVAVPAPTSKCAL